MDGFDLLDAFEMISGSQKTKSTEGLTWKPGVQAGPSLQAYDSVYCHIARTTMQKALCVGVFGVGSFVEAQTIESWTEFTCPDRRVEED